MPHRKIITEYVRKMAKTQMIDLEDVLEQAIADPTISKVYAAEMGVTPGGAATFSVSVNYALCRKGEPNPFIGKGRSVMYDIDKGRKALEVYKSAEAASLDNLARLKKGDG